MESSVVIGCFYRWGNELPLTDFTGCIIDGVRSTKMARSVCSEYHDSTSFCFFFVDPSGFGRAFLLCHCPYRNCHLVKKIRPSASAVLLRIEYLIVFLFSTSSLLIVLGLQLSSIAWISIHYSGPVLFPYLITNIRQHGQQHLLTVSRTAASRSSDILPMHRRGHSRSRFLR